MLRRTACPPVLAWVLAALLLAAQVRGLAHRVAHAAAVPGGSVAATAAEPHDGAHLPGGLECRLLDHLLGSADALPAFAAVPAAAAFADRPPAALCTPAPALAGAAPRSRGPPSGSPARA